MFDKARPMNLGDIFSESFELIKNTISRSIIIALIFTIPAGILLAFGFQTYFANIFHVDKVIIHGSQGDISPDILGRMFVGVFALIFSLIVFYICHLGGLIGITAAGRAASEGRKPKLAELFKEIFSITYIRGIGLGLVILSALIAIFIIFLIITIILTLISSAIVKIFSVIFTIAAIIFVVYTFLHTYFALTHIVYEHEGVFKSISKSFFLVKGYWWRTFGIMLLISIIIGFASTIIAAPITFIFEWDFVVKYLNFITEAYKASTDPSLVIEFMKSFGYVYGIIITISTILQMIAFPLFILEMYYDLRIRKKDFPEELPENTQPEGDTFA